MAGDAVVKPNPLVIIFADLIYFQGFPLVDVPNHLKPAVTDLLATYPADPYLDDHHHLIEHITGLQALLDSKETPTGAQTKATTALNTAKQHTIDKIAEMVNGSPAALDTLFEIAASLNNDPNFATTIVNQLGTKVDKVTGKALSTNDYTSAEKTKLAGVETGANKYVLPATLPSSMITDSSAKRFVTDALMAAWSGKSDFSGSYSDLSNKPSLFSGSYTDLTNKPTIPAAVTLNNTLTSTSTTQGATANTSKVLNDKIVAHTTVADIHRKITFGTAAPTGGADGDVYFRYV